MYQDFENQLEDQIKYLLKNFKLKGIKAEFEAEGSSNQDIINLRKLTIKNKIKLYVKIGGVEAINDIYNCVENGVDGIIAPMVESKFGAKKFIESISKLNLKKKPYLTINIETKSGFEKINEILDISKGFINNITIGRTDLSASYFKNNIKPDSNFITNLVCQISTLAKKNRISTTVGGSINFQTIQNYKKNKSIKSLIKKIETRKVILPSNVLLSKPNALENALKFEELYILYKASLKDFKLSSELSRLTILKTRK